MRAVFELAKKISAREHPARAKFEHAIDGCQACERIGRMERKVEYLDQIVLCETRL